MKLISLFTKAEYTVGYRICGKDIIDDTDTPFKVLPHNDKQWYADPFVFFHEGEWYVFMEVMQNDKGYAGIGYSKLVDGELTSPRIVIDTGKHYSFPFIFEYEGEIFIMPESSAEENIKLFRCIDFPEKWEEYYAVNDERGLCDTVAFEEKNRRFLFTSEGTDDLYGCRLYLMEIESGTLKPSIISEKVVTSDYRHSRQAGKMIRKDGKLIRVAQDCSRNEYGRALEFMEIDDIDNFSEHLIKHIEPKDIKTEADISGKSGIHTYNRENNVDVVDFKLLCFYPKAVFIKLKMVFDIIKSKISG